MSEKDTLTCGNCGYDGGVAHLKDKLEWEKQQTRLHLEVQKAGAIDSDDRVYISGWKGLFTTVSVGVICLAGYLAHSDYLDSKKVPVTRSDTALIEESKVIAYNKCIEVAANQEYQIRVINSDRCNAAFNAK